MLDLASIDWKNVLYLTLTLMGVGLVLAVALLAWVVVRIKRIQLPPGADPITALRATPFSIVLLLDLLDFSLDFLSAPFAWVLLGYLGLQPLRGVTVVESLVPGTQFLPTMTAAWLVARLTDPERSRS